MSAGPVPHIRAALADRLGCPPGRIEFRSVAGGCVHRAYRVTPPEGPPSFLKWEPDPIPGMFTAEAEGLDALRDTPGVRVPEVWAVDDADSWILMEYVAPGSEGADWPAALGRGLAALHERTGGAPGWHGDNWIGGLPQSNRTAAGWAEFWVTRRLLPQVERAFDAGRLDRSSPHWRALPSRVHEVVGDADSAMSLLHGDLWSGNVFPDGNGQPVLVDPAVYRGHAEVDLAMMELFGGFDAALHVYHARLPRDPAFDRIRRDVYQLYPLLVHVNLFGGGYAAQAERAARRVLG